MICHSPKFFYIHIPRTAGNSIDTTFLKLGLVDVDSWHRTAKETMSMLERPWKYFSFATVRNPWERMVSEYFWQMPNSNPDTSHEWGKPNITLEQFCRSKQEWYPREEGRDHMRPQTDYIYSANDELLVDYIVRYEDLGSGWNVVLGFIGLGGSDKIPLPKRNVTQHDHYTKYYTPELRDYVGNLYARDVELLGYKFEEQTAPG